MKKHPRDDRTPREGPREDYDTVLAGYVDCLLDGQELSPELIAAAHPEFGERLVDDLQSFIDPKLGPPANGSDAPLGTLGDYTLRRQIGRGGMGVVYEAWENSMDRAVALKVLPAAVAADNKAFIRFMREAKTAGQLNHQSIVHVHGLGLKERTPYYAMELVEGETLAQILTRWRDVEPGAETVFGKKDRPGYFEKLAETFADVSDGLQHAHSKGVIHRDIKPSNLILDGNGKLRILDFGLARLEGQDSLTRSGDLMGTVLYMSPEQAMAKRVPLDYRTDVYSLGATMYEVLTGKPPFKGKDQYDTLRQIMVRNPRSPRQLNPGVPKDLETIVLKCLRKGADDRYGTAEALGQDLRRFVRGDPIEARLPGRLEICWSWARRRRTALVSVAAILVVGLATGGFLHWYRLRVEQTIRDETIPLIEDLHARGDVLGALDQARSALRLLPTDPDLRETVDGISRVVDITTVPEGARVSVRPARSPDGSWYPLGSSPLSRCRIPKEPLEWQITKPGFEPLVLVRIVEKSVEFQLAGAPGMVHVSPNNPCSVMRALEYVKNPDHYLIDRCEVTNEEFQSFVDDGGYENPEYWTELDAATGAWRSMIADFCDSTGSYGPATWADGRYPPGRENYPVRGVNWYEAVAYARYAGKRLPTVYDWYGAFLGAGPERSEVFRRSNIDQQAGPLPVGQGLGPYGTFDMVGNVREWCWNRAKGKDRFILGGSWFDPPHMDHAPNARPPLSRERDYGFRCVTYLSQTMRPELSEPITGVLRDYAGESPVPMKCSKCTGVFTRTSRRI